MTRRGPSLSRVAIYGFLILVAAIYALPLLFVIFNSFRELVEINANSMIGFPQSFTLEAWAEVWSGACFSGVCSGMAPYFLNSFQMVIPATLISTALGAINGYALSVWRFRYDNAIFLILLLTVFLPGQLFLLPWSILLGRLGMGDTIWSLVLVHTVAGMGFVTLFFRNYYLSVPQELIRAARVDGAGFWQTFVRIILPLSPPIIIIVIIWQFTHIWNEYLFAGTFTSGTERPITAALMALTSSSTAVPRYNVQAAAVILSALPTLLIYIFGGRFFVRGLTAGSVKG
jgi:glucose/mannose transport system permease protein